MQEGCWPAQIRLSEATSVRRRLLAPHCSGCHLFGPCSAVEVNVAGLPVSLSGVGGVLEVGLCLELATGAAILVGLADG